LEIDKKAKTPAGSAKIIETLSHVFIGKMVNTFEFNNEHTLDKDVSEVFSDRAFFVGNSERGLSYSPNSASA